MRGTDTQPICYVVSETDFKNGRSVPWEQLRLSKFIHHFGDDSEDKPSWHTDGAKCEYLIFLKIIFNKKNVLNFLRYSKITTLRSVGTKWQGFKPCNPNASVWVVAAKVAHVIFFTRETAKWDSQIPNLWFWYVGKISLFTLWMCFHYSNNWYICVVYQKCCFMCYFLAT